MNMVVINGAKSAVKCAAPVVKKYGSKAVVFVMSPAGQELAKNIWRTVSERKGSCRVPNQMMDRLEECENFEEFQIVMESIRQLNQGRQKTNVVAV